MKKLIIPFCILCLVFLFTGCKKKFDLPASVSPPPVSGYITIDSIIKRYNAYYAIPPDRVYKFNTDVNVVGVVTADEVSGNLFKSVYIKDATGGMKLNLTFSNYRSYSGSGLFIGDSIRINLNGVKLNSYGNQIQLDSILVDKNVHKIASGLLVKPRKVTLNQLSMINPSVSQLFYQSELIQLDSVEFDFGSKGMPFADAVSKGAISLGMYNSVGSRIILRSSGFANFASSIAPCGKGSIIAIVGQFNGSLQLTLRQLSDLGVATGTCPIVVKTFNDQSLTSGGWTTQNVIGTVNWVTSNAGSSPTYYASISNYPSNQTCETWLISPPFNLTNNINPMLSFQNATNFTGGSLTAMVSTNYTGGATSTATWTPLAYTPSPGSYAFVSSGNISLSAYKTNNVTIAFKYSATGSSATWELDDIAILDY